MFCLAFIKIKQIVFIIICWFLQLMICPIQAQNQSSKSSIGGIIQLSFEQQSYHAESYHHSFFLDVEKHAGICKSLKFEIFQEFQFKKNLLLNYSLGYKRVNQKFYYSEWFTSMLDYIDMGISQINSEYIGGSLGVSYKKSNKKKFHIVPHLSIGTNILIKKVEELTPLKYTFTSIQDPYSSFVAILPEVSLDLLLYYEPNNLKYIFLFGPGLQNNPKYYHEEVGIMSTPRSFVIKLGISKIK